jgi:hypothetical protein
MKSKYEQLATGEKPEKVWDRYGLTFSAWKELTPQQREIHYERHRALKSDCDHPYEFQPIPGYDDILRDSYSFDPYFHTAHMITHDVAKFFEGTCVCQTCILGFGIERGTEKRKLNEEQIKEKIRNRGKHVECFCEACWKKKSH